MGEINTLRPGSHFPVSAYRRKRTISRGVANEVGSADIIRSQCPPYMKPPYGARTRISTCVAIGLVDPPMFYAHCKDQHNLSTRQSEGFVKKLNRSIKPVKADDGKTLFPPYVTVCHDTRYKPNNLVGLTRILGIGKFGEFAKLTMESVSKPLLKEIKRKRQIITADSYCAEFDGAAYVLVLRIYGPTNLGKRSLAHKIRVVSPHKDLGLDIREIEQAARKRYHIFK
jgi:hypothetical protein